MEGTRATSTLAAITLSLRAAHASTGAPDVPNRLANSCAAKAGGSDATAAMKLTSLSCT